jgi:hypothetical protein
MRKRHKKKIIKRWLAAHLPEIIKNNGDQPDWRHRGESCCHCGREFPSYVPFFWHRTSYEYEEYDQRCVFCEYLMPYDWCDFAVSECNTCLETTCYPALKPPKTCEKCGSSDIAVHELSEVEKAGIKRDLLIQAEVSKFPPMIGTKPWWSKFHND